MNKKATERGLQGIGVSGIVRKLFFCDVFVPGICESRWCLLAVVGLPTYLPVMPIFIGLRDDEIGPSSAAWINSAKKHPITCQARTVLSDGNSSREGLSLCLSSFLQKKASGESPAPHPFSGTRPSIPGPKRKRRRGITGRTGMPQLVFLQSSV